MPSPSVLVTLLTSGGLEYLKEAVKSILHQKDTHIDYTVVIIVNTLSDEYYKEVLSYFTLIKVVRTLSNGRPGKGHNSVLDYFKNNPQYDYLIPIDGDDFLYPYALTYIEQYITASRPADILMLMYTDSLQQPATFPHDNAPIICINNRGLLYWHFENALYKTNYRDTWYKQRSKSPFVHDVCDCHTPSRIVLLSRTAIQNDLYYNEDCVLYDDYIAVMKVFELIYTSSLHIMQTDYSGILLYNRLNHNSATQKFTPDQATNENQVFKQAIDNKFTHIRKWDIAKLPIINMSPPIGFNFEVKYEFVKSIFSNVQIEPLEYSKRDQLELYKFYVRMIRTSAVENMDDSIFNVYINAMANISLIN
jgi:hypothetical protein